MRAVRQAEAPADRFVVEAAEAGNRPAEAVVDIVMIRLRRCAPTGDLVHEPALLHRSSPARGRWVDESFFHGRSETF